MIAAVAGCSDPAAPAITAVDACRSLSAEPAVTDSGLADVIPLPDGVDPRSGFTLMPSAVVVFDQTEGRIVALDRAGRERWTFGRSGDGPGEIARPFSTRFIGGPGSQWIAADQSRIAVFDGRTFFILSEQGELLRSWSAEPLATERSGWARRIRMRGDRIYVDLLGAEWRPGAARDRNAPRRGEVYAIDSASVQLVATVELPPLPVNDVGTVSDGLAQAKPRWDLQQDCLVMTDGHSSGIVFIDVRSGKGDTVDVGLPEWYIDVAMANEETRGLTSGAMPEPTAKARVAELTLSADGVLWLRPSAQSARSSAGQIVWRYDLRSGTLVQDSVVAFPRFADRAGAVYGISTDSSGSSVLSRVRQ